MAENLKAEAFGDSPQPMFSLNNPDDYTYFADDDKSEQEDAVGLDELLESLEDIPVEEDSEGESEERGPPFRGGEPFSKEEEEMIDREFEPSPPEPEIELEGEDPFGSAGGVSHLMHRLQGPQEEQGDIELEDEEEALAHTPSHNAFDELMQEDEGMLPGAQVLLFKKDKEEPMKETTWEDDSDHAKFIDYVANKLRGIPPHSGQTTVGCEKAISYLRKIDKEISKAIQSDEDNVISEEQAETLRDKIHDYVDQLEEAYDELVDNKRKKKKKKASFSVGKKVVARINDGQDLQYFVSVANADGEERLLKVEVEEPSDEEVQAFIVGHGLTKEAGSLQVFVDPFLQSIKRLLIRSHITQGKNIQDVYSQLNEQYNFTPREELSIHELLLQSGLPLHADLGRIQEKDVSPMDSKNVEFSTEFYS